MKRTLLIGLLIALGGCVSNSKPSAPSVKEEKTSRIGVGALNSELSGFCDVVLVGIGGMKDRYIPPSTQECIDKYKMANSRIAQYIDEVRHDISEESRIELSNPNSRYCVDLRNLRSRVSKFNFHAREEDKINPVIIPNSCNNGEIEAGIEFSEWIVRKWEDKIAGKVQWIATSNKYTNTGLSISISCDKGKPQLEVRSKTVIGVPSSWHKVDFKVDDNRPYRKKMRLYSNSYDSGYLYNVKKLIQEMKEGKFIYFRVGGYDGYQEKETSLFGADETIDIALKGCN